MDKDRGFLPEEILTSVLFNRFSLELQLNKLAKASKTVSILQRRDLAEVQQAHVQYVAELRLHCDRGYVGFIFDADRVYSVADDWKNCALILIGTPGTHYTLVQGNF